MPNNTILALDIETIPQREQSELSPTVKEWTEKRLDKINDGKQGEDRWDYQKLASLDWDLGRVICISLGLYDEPSGTIRLKSVAGDNEKELLSGFNEVIANFKGDYLHYNGLGFDIPFILQRMAYNRIKPAEKRISQLARYRTSPHYDLMQVWANWDYTRTKPLSVLSKIVGLPNPKQDMDGSMVNEYFQQGKLDEIIRYCEFDTATVLNLYLYLVKGKPVVSLDGYKFSNA